MKICGFAPPWQQLESEPGASATPPFIGSTTARPARLPMTQRKTALITGASVGLGKEFAELFARDGHDVVLVARNTGRVSDGRSRSFKDHGVTAHSMPMDLSSPTAGDELYQSLKSARAAIDFLVNNAGFGSCGPFLEQDLKKKEVAGGPQCRSLLRLLPPIWSGTWDGAAVDSEHRLHRRDSSRPFTSDLLRD